MKVRAISLWQPWASLIVTGAKTYETRSWSTSYRGPLVICAAKGGLPKYEERDLIEASWSSIAWKFQGALAPVINKPFSMDLEMNQNHEWPGVKISDLPRGMALCICDLVACIPTGKLTQDDFYGERWFGNYEIGRFAWKLQNVRPFDSFFAVKGKQGLFEVEIPESV